MAVVEGNCNPGVEMIRKKGKMMTFVELSGPQNKFCSSLHF